MENNETSASAQLWKVQVKLDSLIFLFENFQVDDSDETDKPLSGIAVILQEVQSELNWLQDTLGKTEF